MEAAHVMHINEQGMAKGQRGESHVLQRTRDGKGDLTAVRVFTHTH